MKDIGVYIHIPFCKSKCTYCDFISFDKKQELIGKYISALKRLTHEFPNSEHTAYALYLIANQYCYSDWAIVAHFRDNFIGSFYIQII